MDQNRITIFRQMLAQQPDDAMTWYGLGNELFKAEDWQGAADALRKVVQLKADFTAAYQLLGSALLQLGQRDAAKLCWLEGISVSNHTGAWKARSHLEALVAELTNNGS
jgi:uncharacterized protein HemY